MRRVAIAGVVLAALVPAPSLGAGQNVSVPVRRFTIEHGPRTDVFKGVVRAKEFGDAYESPGCRKERQVVVKRKRPGRDKVVNRDLTNRRGRYYAPNFLWRDKFHRGRFQAKVIEVRLTAKGRPTVVCEAAVSKIIRVR